MNAESIYRLALLIDDNEGDRYLNRRLLIRSGFVGDVREFTYASDALGFLRSPDRPHIDLILIDINMPRMNGFEFADRFEELYAELKGETLLVVLSGSLDPDDRARAEAHPTIDGYVTKPIEVASLTQLTSNLRKGKTHDGDDSPHGR